MNQFSPKEIALQNGNQVSPFWRGISMWRFAPLLVLASLMPVCAGCSSSDHTIVTTGLFNDDLAVMNIAYDQVVADQTTEADLLKLGFDYRAGNVRVLRGTQAMRAIFGDTVFQGALANHPDPLPFLDEYNHYRLLVFPYQNVAEDSTGFLLFGRDTDRTGSQTAMYFLLRDDLVVYCACDGTELNELRSRQSITEGIPEVLRSIPQVPRIPGISW